MLKFNLRFNLEYVAVRRQVIAASTTWPAFPLRAGHGESVFRAVVRAGSPFEKLRKLTAWCVVRQAHHEGGGLVRG
jgi:hypothetical protein